MKTRKKSDQKSTSSRRSSASESTSVNQNICEQCKCQIQKLAKSDDVAAVEIKLSNLEKQIAESQFSLVIFVYVTFLTLLA